jgi:hypothetical protein
MDASPKINKMENIMSIIDQWKPFSQGQMTRHGFDLNFYPFKSEFITKEIRSTSTGYPDIFYVGVDKIPRHKDEDESLRYTAFLVVRNDGIVIKGTSSSQKAFHIQYPGTIVVLDIHKYHTVVRDVRMGTTKQNPIWIAATIDYKNKPDRQQVEMVFYNFLVHCGVNNQ